jgi:hypothetical protein
MPAPPHKLRASSRRRDVVYELADDLVALHHPRDKLQEAEILRRRPKRGRTGPVYYTGDSRTLAVPTGRLFVRLKKGLRAESKEAAFARAGYAIADIPSYAPNAAWLAPARGSIADSLARIGRVERIAGVVNVEPELLQPRVAR